MLDEVDVIFHFLLSIPIFETAVAHFLAEKKTRKLKKNFSSFRAE